VGASVYVESRFLSSLSTEYFFPDIRPELRREVADEIEPDSYRALDEPEARRIEPGRIPKVGKNG
jgi:hypothetical protein